MKKIKWMSGDNLPLEMHKTRIVQKLNLLEPEKRLEAMREAGFNTFFAKKQRCIFRYAYGFRSKCNVRQSTGGDAQGG